MAKEFFKDLPNTTTPLTSARINGLLDGEEAMGNIKVDSIESKNLFNHLMVEGGWIDSSNIIHNEYQTTYCYTQYIEVEPDTSYTLNLYDATGLNSASILEYNNSFVFLNVAAAETSTTITFITSTNTHYVRFTCRQDSKQNVQLEKGDSATEYSEYQGIGYISGSNANGRYIKYSDGTLIQYGSITTSVDIQQHSGTSGFYFEDGKSISLPQSFYNTNYFAIVVASTNQLSSFGVYGVRPTTTSSFLYDIQSAVAYTSNSFKFIWCAIGRWK